MREWRGLKERMGISRGLTLFQCKIIFRQRKMLDLAEQNVDFKFISTSQSQRAHV